MIGQFRFAPNPSDETIAISMSWQDDQPQGSIYFPPDVRHLAEEADHFLVQHGETLTLGMALGIGVMLAALTNHALCLSGDETAWRQEWGRLSRVN